jgi:hypothetical protein
LGERAATEAEPRTVTAPGPAGPIDVVMPLHPGKGDVLDLLRAASSIGSLGLTGSVADVGTIFVVHPRGIGSMVGALEAIDPRVRPVVEDEMFSAREYGAVRMFGGWRRQQFVKLGANRLSAAPAILACDADATAINRMTADLVIRGGRVLVQAGSQIRKWVDASFGLMGVEPPARFMSVTPTFLSGPGLAIAQQRIEARLGAGWVEGLTRVALAGTEWTEYTIYQAALMAAGEWDRLHFTGPGHPVNQGIWARSLDNEELIRKLAGRKPLFFVYQSTREDFFRAQGKMAACGLPVLADLPAPAQLGPHRALAEFAEVRRYWGRHAEASLGRFRSEYVDLLRAAICGGPAPAPEDVFYALTVIWLGATLVAEQALDRQKWMETGRVALAAMEAWPPLAGFVASNAEFQALIGIVLRRERGVPPRALVRVLVQEDTSRPLFRYLLKRMRKGSLEDVLAVLERRIDRKRAPIRAVTDTAQWALNIDKGVALRLMRRTAPDFRHRDEYWHNLAVIWGALGKERAARRAQDRADAIVASRGPGEAAPPA